MDREDSETQGSKALREEPQEYLKGKLRETCAVNSPEWLSQSPNLYPGLADYWWARQNACAQGNWD